MFKVLKGVGGGAEKKGAKNTLSGKVMLQKGKKKKKQSFPDKQKRREFISIRSALQETIKGVFQIEMKLC